MHPPTRHALSTHLLDVQVKVKQIIEKADYIAIIFDGRLNVVNCSLPTNISTPQPVFYKGTDTPVSTLQMS
jgi:hypothetical protein